MQILQNFCFASGSATLSRASTRSYSGKNTGFQAPKRNVEKCIKTFHRPV